MSASIEITHAPGRVTLALIVEGKSARVAVTPERAKRIAAQLVMASVDAENASTTPGGAKQNMAEMLRGVVEDVLGRPAADDVLGKRGKKP